MDIASISRIANEEVQRRAAEKGLLGGCSARKIDSRSIEFNAWLRGPDDAYGPDTGSVPAILSEHAADEMRVKMEAGFALMEAQKSREQRLARAKK